MKGSEKISYVGLDALHLKELKSFHADRNIVPDTHMVSSFHLSLHSRTQMWLFKKGGKRICTEYIQTFSCHYLLIQST